MTKKVLILKGSPREKGNSAALAERVAAGAREAGAQVESVYLHSLDIHPCDACDECQEKGTCIIEDDMQPLYSKISSLPRGLSPNQTASVFVRLSVTESVDQIPPRH